MVLVSPAATALPSGPSDFTFTRLDGGGTVANDADITTNPDDQTNLFACHGTSNGLFFNESTNGGSTWDASSSTVDSSESYRFGQCAIDAENGSHIAISASTEAGAVKAHVSSDGGTTWATTQLFGARRPNTIQWTAGDDLVAMWHDTVGNDLEAAVSTDAGSTWGTTIIVDASFNAQGQHFMDNLHTIPGDPDRVRVFYDNTNTRVSTNGGETWSAEASDNTSIGDSDQTGWTPLSADTWVIAKEGSTANVIVEKTTDGGQTWTQLDSRDEEMFVFSGVSNQTMAYSQRDSGSQAGIVATEDGWTSSGKVTIYESDRCSSRCRTSLDVPTNGQFATVMADAGTGSTEEVWAAVDEAPDPISDITPDQEFGVDAGLWDGVEVVPKRGANGTVVAVNDGEDDLFDTDVYRLTPDLTLLESFEPCDPIDGLQDVPSGDFVVTEEGSPSIVLDCQNTQLRDGLAVLSPTGSFQSFFNIVNATNLAGWFSAEMDAGTGNQVTVFSRTSGDDVLVLADPVNRGLEWEKNLADMEGVGWDSVDNRSLATGGFGSRAFDAGGTLLASDSAARENGKPHDGFALLCDGGTANFTYNAGGFTFQAQNITDRFVCQDNDGDRRGVELTSDGRFGVVWEDEVSPGQVTVFNASSVEAIAEDQFAAGVVDAAFSWDCRFLYVANASSIFRYDLRSVNGFETCGTAAPTAEASQESQVTQPGDSTLTDLSAAANALGVDEEIAGIFFSFLAIAIFAIGGYMVAGSEWTGAMGAFVGIGLTWTYGWLKDWVLFLVVLIIAVLMVLALRRRG